MKRELDLKKFISEKDVYLRQRYSTEDDYEILSRWEHGESVISLSQAFHRSPSAIYRLRERVINFLDNPPSKSPEDFYYRLLSDLYIEVPLPLLLCARDCTDQDAYMLFRLSVGLYASKQLDFFPRWFLSKISSSLGRKDYALQTLSHMAELHAELPFFTYQIYDSVTYDHGIRFRFSKVAEGIIDSVPIDLLITQWDD